MRRTGLAMGALFALIGGCDERPERLQDPLDLEGPFLGEARVAWLSAGRRAALVLEPDGPEVTLVPLSGRPRSGVLLAGGERLLALSPDDEALDLVNLTDARLERAYELRSPFDALSVSEDGGYAIASFAGGGGSILSNASEVAVVDLAAPAGAANPAIRTIASAGGAVVGMEVSPPFGPLERRIALVRSENHVAAIDLTKPLGATRSIPLASPGSGASVMPTRIVFDVDGDSLDAFVVVVGLDDLYHLRFDGTSGEDGAPPPVLNQFAAGKSPRDIAVWRDGQGGRRLLVASPGSGSLVVLDVDSAQSTEVPLGLQIARILLYGGEGDDREALVWGAPGKSSRFFRVVLGDLAEKKSKAASAHDLALPIEDVAPVAGGAWFLVTHTGGNIPLTLVSASTPSILPFTGGGSVDGFAVDEAGASVFLASSTYDGTDLSVIDVATGHPETRELRGVHAYDLRRIPGTDWLLLLGNLWSGRVTLVDGADPMEGEVVRVNPIGLEGILDLEGGP